MSKQMYRANLTIFVDGIYADTAEEADEQIHKLIDKLGAVKTKLEWQEVDWELEEVIDYDTDYSGDLPKDIV